MYSSCTVNIINNRKSGITTMYQLSTYLYFYSFCIMYMYSDDCLANYMKLNVNVMLIPEKLYFQANNPLMRIFFIIKYGNEFEAILGKYQVTISTKQCTRFKRIKYDDSISVSQKQ